MVKNIFNNISEASFINNTYDLNNKIPFYLIFFNS